MNYFQLLTKEDIQTVCRSFPHKEMIQGFKKNPKAFNEMAKGYRPQSISEDRGRKLLLENSHTKLVTNMIEEFLKRWSSDISQRIEEYTNAGNSEIESHLKAFQDTIFPDGIELYFRLIEKPISAEYASLLTSAVSVLASERKKMSNIVSAPQVKVGDLEQERKDHKIEIRAKDSEIKKRDKAIEGLNTEIANLSTMLETLQGDLSRQIERIQELEESQNAQKKELEDAISTAHTFEVTVNRQKTELQEALSAVDAGKKREADQQVAIDSLQEKLSNIENALAEMREKPYQESDQLLYPTDIDEFSEYLGYNLKSIGVNGSTDEYNLLTEYLCDILFQNKPIMCNHVSGMALARCVSNALCGTKSIKILPYSSEITSKDILYYLNSEERILVLDGFLGNFNEMELIPIATGIRGKIIFMTLEYERTIAYLPKEVLLYFNYLNVSRIKDFFSEKPIDEDATEIMEQWIPKESKAANRNVERLCTEIMKQLGFGNDISLHIAQRMVSEEKLAQYLAFSILPYSCEALDYRPYETSERLQKYAGEQGKCRYKSLLLGWFGNE